MLVWRIAKDRYALDREAIGSVRAGGRWNNKGTPMIYTGTSVEICALEKLVHVDGVLPDDLVLVEIVLPDDLELYIEPAINDLPKGWNEIPDTAASRDFGDGFVSSMQYLGLVVPSVIVPEARNMLINPHHQAFKGATMTVVRPFPFDSRLRP